MTILAEFSTRPITAADDAALRRIYASTRKDELSAVPWSSDEKRAFLNQQYEAQHQFYREQFSEASFRVVMVGDLVVGRLYLDRRHNEMRIIDIALLPTYRGRGIGSSLLREILVESDSVCLPVRIHVERNNPAKSLYHRLGFECIEERGVYDLMERPASTRRVREGMPRTDTRTQQWT